MKQNAHLGRSTTIAGIVALALLALVAAWLRPSLAARGGDPPPDLPAFEGEPVSETFAAPDLAARQADIPQQAQGWTVVLDEDFENGIDTGIWLNVDRDGTENGEYKWGTRAVDNPLNSGDESAWAVGGGANGSGLNFANKGYPKNANSWLIHGPFSMAGVYDAQLSFNYFMQADSGDTFAVLVSTDGTTWQGKQVDNGGTGNWDGRSVNLDDYLGKPVVYIAFRFQSDANGPANNKKKGAMVDDIELRLDFGNRQYLPHIQVQPSPTPTATPTVVPTPTPTATPPSGNYLNDFTNDVNGWEVRRHDNGASFGFQHRGDSDGGRQGFLEMELTSTDSFFTMSPLVAAKKPPYNIEVMAKLKDPRDRHMYGIVFGGDWNGQACPTAGFTSCFNRYYELRVQYRDTGGKRFQEVKLKRIDSHDGSGEPVGTTLVDWTKGGNVGTDDWVEIDVYVSASGTINISWNGKFIAQTNDPTLINQPYFGLQLITRENGNGRVKFDYIKID
jgi:hypothetical protein